MPNITTCTRCGRLYEESSEEAANEPGRVCLVCYRAPVEPAPVADSGPVAGPETGSLHQEEPTDVYFCGRKLFSASRLLALPLAGLLLCGTLSATPPQAPAPDAKPAPREKPILTITVRVYPDGPRFQVKGADEVKGMPGARILLRGVDQDSCTVWVNRDDHKLKVEAFKMCDDAAATATPAPAPAVEKGGPK